MYVDSSWARGGQRHARHALLCRRPRRFVAQDARRDGLRFDALLYFAKLWAIRLIVMSEQIAGFGGGVCAQYEWYTFTKPLRVSLQNCLFPVCGQKVVESATFA